MRRRNRLAVLAYAGIAVVSCSTPPRPDRIKVTTRAARVMVSARTDSIEVAKPATAAAPCPAVHPTQFYSFLAGPDSCLTPMPLQQQATLNDPYGLLLQHNQNGVGPWPASVAAVVSAVGTISGALAPQSFVLGEGSQVPPAVTPNTSNRNLRYVVAWAISSGSTPAVFLSSRPDATPPIFLEVIGWDPKKQAFNYYQYISNNDLTGDPGTVQTWSYAGDSSNAGLQVTGGQGCFACHRNGGMNMKELKVPWNNWHSASAAIPKANVPPAMATDPLFVNKTTADQLQLNVFQPIMQRFMAQQVSAAISNGTVSNVAALLRHLITTTTVNFRSTQVNSRPSAFPPMNVPTSLFLNEDMLGNGTNNGLNLGYTTPTLSIPAGGTAGYNTLVSPQGRNYYLINTTANNRPPQYTWPGDTFFGMFYPEPPYEDVIFVQQLWTQNIVSSQFASAVLMVDYPNPVFSPVRDTLLQYSAQISSGNANGKDIPTQFATLVQAAAAQQPACGSTDLTKCTAEQQFVGYWTIAQQANWQTQFAAILSQYLSTVAGRLATNPGDYLTLVTSRQEQFQNYSGVCNLYEFDIMLPCNTMIGSTFYTMNSDGTLAPQTGYTCPTRADTWVNPCSVPVSVSK